MNKKLNKKRTTKEFIDLAISIHGTKYDYRFVNYSNKDSKVKIICPTHGEFFQRPATHLKGAGCEKCGFKKISKSKQLSNDQFKKKVISKHGNKYNLDNVDYTGYTNKVSVGCEKHGQFECIADYLIHKNECCPECIKNNINNNIEFAKEKYSKGTIKFIKEAMAIHDDIYDYSLTKYRNNKTPVTIICKKHGKFTTLPISHINKKTGCQKCSYERNSKTLSLTKDEFISKSVDIFGDEYTYNNVDYVNAATNVIITCKKHGDFVKLPTNHLSQEQGCPKCSCIKSKQEISLYEYVKKYKNVIPNDRSVLEGRELDIFIPDLNVAIEYNGIYWHSEKARPDKKHLLKKLNDCKTKNIRLIHIFEPEWVSKQKIVQSRLKNILKLNKYKIFARKCEVREIPNKIKCAFLNKYHIQSNDKSSVKLGLFYKNKLVSVMTFCKNRKALGKNSINGEWELSRFASISNFSVIGGAGKLLKYFERNWKPKKITSYADKRWSNGTLYEKLGFLKIRESSLNYWYFKGSGKELYHRFNFRKSELPKKLEKFDSNMTEWENMKKNGWNRIWDCGNLVFEKNF